MRLELSSEDFPVIFHNIVRSSVYAALLGQFQLLVFAIDRVAIRVVPQQGNVGAEMLFLVCGLFAQRPHVIRELAGAFAAGQEPFGEPELYLILIVRVLARPESEWNAAQKHCLQHPLPLFRDFRPDRRDRKTDAIVLFRSTQMRYQLSRCVSVGGKPENSWRSIQKLSLLDRADFLCPEILPYRFSA